MGEIGGLVENCAKCGKPTLTIWGCEQDSGGRYC